MNDRYKMYQFQGECDHRWGVVTWPLWWYLSNCLGKVINDARTEVGNAKNCDDHHADADADVDAEISADENAGMPN